VTLNFEGGGMGKLLRVTVKHKGTVKQPIIWHPGEKTLSAFFKIIQEKREPPHTCATITAALRAQGFHVWRDAVGDDIHTFCELGVLEVSRIGREHYVKPVFNSFSIFDSGNGLVLEFK